jgi:hypothetical protein
VPSAARSNFAVAIGIGKQRGDGITRARFDPDMRRAIGEAEHQQRLGAMPGDELGKFAIDGVVGDMENVADQFDVTERRAPQPRQPLHKRHRRVEGRAGERAESGEENAKLACQSILPVTPAKAGIE